jgi:hypothetical protein
MIEPDRGRQPFNPEEKADNGKEAWSPREPGTLFLDGAGSLSNESAGRFQPPAWLISDDPGREE